MVREVGGSWRCGGDDLLDGEEALILVLVVNAEPGAAVRFDGRLVAVIALEVRAGRITQLHGIGNPAKLHDFTG